jgi:hypothetical protein
MLLATVIYQQAKLHLSTTLETCVNIVWEGLALCQDGEWHILENKGWSP